MRRQVAWCPVILTLALAVTACTRPAAEREATDKGADLIPNARWPFAAVLTGGQPSLDEFRAARAQGYQTVINLRTAGEPGAGPQGIEELGLEYVSIPVNGAAGVTEENARRLAQALEEAEEPVMVYCGSGNRVGALFALKAFHVDGASPEEALEIGKEAGLTRLEPVVRGHLGLPPD